ncbi:Hypothetical Protein FCC1311_057722 [Hondaea fermentalgiana]|uniref:Uncharacterized protein n=1 Tax=Hondaea fermentalgiana TaxID=2315210 RepID=A0A2R5GMM2_9STRA|nr:Hypothetical Protein FCC1311_057722 [Hondaea fermentalgiana]|eukprot:GBG29551.1 Hypothetical Protein FCC1311_057722 [Hondaea fermentalgiana]
MPWLVHDEEKPEDDLLFVHVPRCGGTSLTKHYNVARKCRKGLWPWRRFGMLYWFYRYRLLEKANFPFITIENAIFVCQYTVAIILYLTVPAYRPGNDCDAEDTFCGYGVTAYSLFATGATMFLVSTFLGTAPFIGRQTILRRIYAVFFTYVLCNWMGREKWLVGCNIKGWFVHFTAAKMLKYESIEEKDLENSFAIVRNPYSRMVSVYMYNRFGPLESFKGFVKRWCTSKLALYRQTGSTEEWDTYCHALPMFEYTHLDGEQIVKCIIKQEELKTLWMPGLKIQSRRHKKRLKEIPPKVADALRSMPHANSRKRSKPWWDYYDQELVDLVATNYAEDFYYFGYDIALPNRPDLKPPPIEPPPSIRPFSSNLDFSIYKDQDLKGLARRVSSQISTSSSLRSTSRRHDESRMSSSMATIGEPDTRGSSRRIKIRVDSLETSKDDTKEANEPASPAAAKKAVSSSAATVTEGDLRALDAEDDADAAAGSVLDRV